jgi:hypothetical protein
LQIGCLHGRQPRDHDRPTCQGLPCATTYFLASGRYPAATPRPSLTPLSPSLLALDHSAQSPTAQARTEPLMRTAWRGSEELITAGAGTRRLWASTRWALTLALRLGHPLGPGPLGLPLIACPPPIPATLLAAALPATVRLPPGLTGTPRSPAVRRPLTCRTAIPRLRPPGLKDPLASLQQTTPPPRPPARALPRTRFPVMLMRTQGSVNSRRSSLGEESLSSPRRLIPAALSFGLPPLQANHPAPRPPLPAGRPPPATRLTGRRNGSIPGRR